MERERLMTLTADMIGHVAGASGAGKRDGDFVGLETRTG